MGEDLQVKHVGAMSVYVCVYVCVSGLCVSVCVSVCLSVFQCTFSLPCTYMQYTAFERPSNSKPTTCNLGELRTVRDTDICGAQFRVTHMADESV